MDPPVFGQARVARAHRQLDLDREGHGFHDAGKFHQGAIAHQLDGAAVILLRLGIDQLGAVGFERRQGRRLVLAHEARVTDHVGGEYGSKPEYRGRKTSLSPWLSRLVSIS